MRREYTIGLKNRTLELGKRTLVMGILNVTPDSFSDGGRFLSTDIAVGHALKMIGEGADIIDIGGESTRPGAKPIGVDEEIHRTIPVIKGIRKASDIPISIDTYRSDVAAAALEAGADIVNDISACRFDGKMPGLVARTRVPVIIMHIKGTPGDMQKDPAYTDVIGEIKAYLTESIETLVSNGVDRKKIIIDPGIGFGKTTEHNLLIMRRLEEFLELNSPILVGVSRKSVIGNVLGLPVDQRLFGTAAAVALNIAKGAHIIRVHDVREMAQVAKMADAILTPSSF